MRRRPLTLAGAVLGLLTACATTALAPDNMDSAAAQREGLQFVPYARPDTTVGFMRADWKGCQAGSEHLQKLAEAQQPITKGISGEALLDVATLGTHSLSLQKESYAEAAECMKAKGYTRSMPKGDTQ